MELLQRSASYVHILNLFLGKTRTKDKYRIVYTEYQRKWLEEEFLKSRYITIRRKAELSRILSLTERQVRYPVRVRSRVTIYFIYHYEDLVNHFLCVGKKHTIITVVRHIHTD